MSQSNNFALSQISPHSNAIGVFVLFGGTALVVIGTLSSHLPATSLSAIPVLPVVAYLVMLLKQDKITIDLENKVIVVETSWCFY